MSKSQRRRRRSSKVSGIKADVVAEKAVQSKEQIEESIRKKGYAEVPPEDL